MIAQKAFEVEVRIEKPGNGILVAQGGDAHGWGLSLENGILRFFVCLNGKVETVTAKEKLSAKDLKVMAKLNSSGEVELHAGTRASWGRKAEQPGEINAR